MKMEVSFECSLCNLKVIDEFSLKLHLKGKNHKKRMEFEKLSRKRSENGLYLSGYPLDMTKKDLQVIFEAYGELEEFIHFHNKTFTLLMYKSRDSVEKVLRSPIEIGGRRLCIRRRKTQPFPRSTGDRCPERAQIRLELQHVKTILTKGNLDALVKELELPEEDRVAKQLILCRDLELVFSKHFPGCKARPFGSVVTGLAFKDSDLDILMDLSGCIDNVKLQDPDLLLKISSPEDLVKLSRKILYQHHKNFDNIIAIPKAKIPIIKFFHTCSGINCDVSFRNGLGVCNSQLIHFFVSLDPRVRPFLMIIKYWARIHNLTGSGKFTNYALVMIALFYLQQTDSRLVPTVTELQLSCHEDNLIDDWLCSFERDPLALGQIRNESSLIQLLYGFFHYYSQFDYGENVISPLIGTAIPKALFTKPDALPESLHLYKDRKNKLVSFKVNTDMCVQDPFELTHNLTCGLCCKTVSTFCSYCQLGKEICEAVLKDSEASLHELFNAEKKPQLKRCIMNGNKMMLTIPVGQYLSLGMQLQTDIDYTLQSEIPKSVLAGWWYALVYNMLTDLLNKGLKLKLEEVTSLHIVKVPKLGEPSDVHRSARTAKCISLDVKTLHCKGFYNLWDNRKKTQKTLTLPQNVIAREKFISEAMIEARYKSDTPTEPLVKFDLTFEPKQDPTCVVLTFTDDGSQAKAFLPLVFFLQTRIIDWVEKCMQELHNQRQMARVCEGLISESIEVKVPESDLTM